MQTFEEYLNSGKLKLERLRAGEGIAMPFSDLDDSRKARAFYEGLGYDVSLTEDARATDPDRKYSVVVTHPVRRERRPHA